jgi:flagellar hook-length control protein FliK
VLDTHGHDAKPGTKVHGSAQPKATEHTKDAADAKKASDGGDATSDDDATVDAGDKDASQTKADGTDTTGDTKGGDDATAGNETPAADATAQTTAADATAVQATTVAQAAPAAAAPLEVLAQGNLEAAGTATAAAVQQVAATQTETTQVAATTTQPAPVQADADAVATATTDTQVETGGETTQARSQVTLGTDLPTAATQGKEVSTSGNGQANPTGSNAPKPVAEAGPTPAQQAPVTVPGTQQAEQVKTQVHGEVATQVQTVSAAAAAQADASTTTTQPQPTTGTGAAAADTATATVQAGATTGDTTGDDATGGGNDDQGDAHLHGLANAAVKAGDHGTQGRERATEVQADGDNATNGNPARATAAASATPSAPVQPTTQANAQAHAQATDAAASAGSQANVSADAAPVPQTANTPVSTAQVPGTVAAGRGDETAQLRMTQERIDNIATQLATRLRLSSAAGGSQVHLSLRPRELGDVHVSLTMRDGVVAASVLVDRVDTGRLLNAQIEDLRRSLEQQGLDVQQFSVDVRDGGTTGGSFANANTGNGGGAVSGSNATAGSDESVDYAPGLMGGNTVTPEDNHNGNVSILA